MTNDSPKDVITEALATANYDLSIQEIAERTDLSRETVSKYLQVLIAEEQVQQTRTVGHAKFYTDRET